MNHKKALFCVRLHCTVIPITSSRKVSCVGCCAAAASRQKSNFPRAPLPGEALLLGSQDPRPPRKAPRSRPRQQGSGSRAECGGGLTYSIHLSSFRQFVSTKNYNQIIKHPLAKPLLQKFYKVCGLSNADCMERLQDQTRSEESGQGVIIQSRNLTTRAHVTVQYSTVQYSHVASLRVTS